MPGGDVPGASTVCQGINNSAQVVCAYDINNDFNHHVFVGSPHDDDDHGGDRDHQDHR